MPSESVCDAELCLIKALFLLALLLMSYMMHCVIQAIS